MKDKTKPKIQAILGGETVRLCYDKRALFRLGQPEHSGAYGWVDVNNEAALFHRACVWAFCLVTDRSKFESAEDVAAVLEKKEAEPLMHSIMQAIEAGKSPEKGEAEDPLSGNGPSPGEGSA